MKKSKRLLPVRNLNHQTERTEAKKLAQLQQNLLAARQQKSELESYLSEYFETIANHTKQVNQARQLGLYQAFISRLQQAINNQGEKIKQHEMAFQKQTQKWIAANAKLKSMDDLIERAKQEEALIEAKKEQKLMDDRPFRRNTDFDE